MTNEQAISILDQVTGRVEMNRQSHIMAQQALAHVSKELGIPVQTIPQTKVDQPNGPDATAVAEPISEGKG